MTSIAPKHQPSAGPTLTKAVKRAAEYLGFKQIDLASVLGISPASASRLYAGNYVLEPDAKNEWQLALLFVRMFRSLDAILGHDQQARTWLNGENLGLGARPIDLIHSTEGLVRVVHYLDAYRGRI